MRIIYNNEHIMFFLLQEKARMQPKLKERFVSCTENATNEWICQKWFVKFDIKNVFLDMHLDFVYNFL